jgi:ubiquitin carboxyl-terminal hydrolase 1
VRPIQNAPFLDIPVVPTSVPNYLAKAHHPAARPPPPNTSPLPACTLDQCLADFTSVERVQDVECRPCTLQKEVEDLEEEALLLRGAIESMEKQIKQKGGDPSDQVKCLHEDLSKIEIRLFQLKTLDPDEEESSLFEQTLDNDPWLEDIDGTVAPKKKRTLERCDAKKCLVLTRCPSILCCHVQLRYFDATTNRMEKCVQFVEFPQELDLSPYCVYGPRASTPWAAGSQKEQHCMDRSSDIGGKMPYRLLAIIEHRGNAHSGHYVSYRRDHSGKWFRISDSNVTPISWRQVRTCQAYMLFYEGM